MKDVLSTRSLSAIVASRNATSVPAPALNIPKLVHQRAKIVFPDAPPEQSFADGTIVGAKGTTYRSSTSWDLIKPVLPSRQISPAEKIIFINGINTPTRDFLASIQALADSADGACVIGVYNATRGVSCDWVRGFTDHVSAEENAAIMSLARLICEVVGSNQPVTIVAHSQGATATSQALRIARDRLAERMTPPELARALAGLRVETHGGAAGRFIDGPQYVHYINSQDPVPHCLGVSPNVTLSTLHYPGKGAVFRYFTHRGEESPKPGMGYIERKFAAIDETIHSVMIYFGKRQPFAKARASGSTAVDRDEKKARFKWAPLRFVLDVLAIPLSSAHLF